MCSFNIEDEYHFVLCCNAYNDLRYIYLPKEYYSQPDLHKFNMLMSSRLSDTIHSLESLYEGRAKSSVTNRLP